MIVRVSRGRGDGTPTIEESFEVPHSEGMRVLDALNYIHDHLDGTLAYRWMCRTGQCGSCAVRVDDVPSLACKTEIPAGTELVTIEPLHIYPRVRDLVVDLDRGMAKLERIAPYAVRGTGGCEPGRAIDPNEAAALTEVAELRRCIECYLCLDACPVVGEAWEDYAGPLPMRKLHELDRTPGDSLDRVALALKEGLYHCTICKGCSAVCPESIDIPEKAVEKLRSRAVVTGRGPMEKHVTILKNIENYDNPWGYPRANRGKWAKKLGVKDATRERVDVLYYVGCTASYDANIQNLALSTARILDRAGVSFGILGKNEVCCGSTANKLGCERTMRDLARRNIEMVNSLGVREIVFSCAGCYRSFHLNYPAFGELKPRVYHITEFVQKLLTEGRLGFEKGFRARVTYHDPCNIGRHCGIFDPPRAILRSIPGLDFIDMKRSRSWSRCCGSGGGLRAHNLELSEKISRRRFQDAIDTGADVLTTSCPFCHQNFTHRATTEPGRLRVMELLEILDQAL